MAKNPDSSQRLDLEALEASQRAGIVDWVSKHLGGEVREITRLERWRPLWKVDYSKGGEDKAVLVRGDRPISAVYSLEHEMRVMQVLEANGIGVPHIHGWMDRPTAFVMDWIDSEDRAPGMLHTAIENPTRMTDERWQAMLSYMDRLAEVHRVPVGEFTHIESLVQPKTAREIALNSTERIYAAGVEAGLVDTALEFLQSWLRRNVPLHRTEARFVTGDAGQFMSSGSDVVALLDFEIAFIGDTHWDLAVGRAPTMRNPIRFWLDQWARPRTESVEEVVFRSSESQIRTVYSAVYGELNTGGGTNTATDLETACRRIGENTELLGFEFFRLLSGTNHVWIALNPDLKAWLEPEAHHLEIAAYWPLLIQNNTTFERGYVAIHYGGQKSFLRDMPVWEPFPIWRLPRK